MSLTLCWERTFNGRNPSTVVVAGSGVACSFVDDQGAPGTPGRQKLVCLDSEGHERWSARDFQLEIAQDDALIGVTRAEELRVLDLDGRKCGGIRDGRKALRVKGVIEVRKAHDHLVVRTKSDVFVTDFSLRLLDRYPLPPRADGVVVDGGVMYIDGDRVMRSDLGRTEMVCRIPVEIAHETMNQWETQTGRPALHGVWRARLDPDADLATELVAAITDQSRQTPFKMSDRSPHFAWYLRYVEAAKALFLVNGTHPHLLLLLERDGRAKWCTYLSPECCGGAPAVLGTGEFVVSSGCGGIVSWLDSNGRVLRRTEPHAGTGLATAYSSHVRALGDSSCIVNGGPGVVSYAADGTLRWIWNQDCSCFDYDERLGLLVTADWMRNDDEKKSVSIRCIKNLVGRSASA